jgi:hypothetical protein
MAASTQLLARGLHVPAIRPPTVPQGTSRLRVSLSAAHSAEDVRELVAALRDCGVQFRQLASVAAGAERVVGGEGQAGAGQGLRLQAPSMELPAAYAPASAACLGQVLGQAVQSKL